MERITRRRLLGGGVAGLVAAAIPGIALAAPKTRLAYKLDPEWGAGDLGCPPFESLKSRSCHGCHACHVHAANKLWRSAAVIRRAHPYCKCDIVSAAIPKGAYVALFGPEARPHRGEVDRRHTRVQAILRFTGV